LYRDTLGFVVDKTESKYYADGEDAFSMRMDLSDLRTVDAEGEDEGDAVGSEGAKDGKKESKEKKRTVKVGRGLGVGDLVEKNESHGKENGRAA
jgi:peptide alpha-N-acetyltransferase